MVCKRILEAIRFIVSRCGPVASHGDPVRDVFYKIGCPAHRKGMFLAVCNI